MNPVERLESQLPAALADVGGTPADYIDDILGRTARTRQRPAWTFPGRWFPMLPHASAHAPAHSAVPVRLVWLLLLVGLLVAALAAGGAFIAGTRAIPRPGPEDMSAALAALPPTDCPDDTPLATGMIATIAGGGHGQGDGGQATDASIDVGVGGLAVDSTGAAFFTGYGTTGIRRVGIDGIISTIVGSPDTPLPAALAGLDFAPDGSLVVADPGDGQILRMGPDGTISVIAGPGTGTSAGAGDGGPALAATVHPSHVKVGPDGSIYFDDVPRYRVIDPAGIVHAFAGTTTAGFAGDGRPATTALLGGADPKDRSYPDVEGSAIAPDGSVYLTDNANSRIRRVDPTGIITTIAGTGERGYTGDSGPALLATFQDPVDLAFDDGGNLYVAEHNNNVVRKIDAKGIITTVAGTGKLFPLADCGPATEAALKPWAIAVHGGYLYIADMVANRIRVVRL